ncbi:MAG: hypothetical protein JXM70_24170 [Pirellulales bacterium]|nr:hypothetical protein [Pirellulales bacterium]
MPHIKTSFPVHTALILALLFMAGFLCPTELWAELSKDEKPGEKPPVWAESDTWAATDALGRKLPASREVGTPKEDKIVAMFYWTWHVDFNAAREPVNVNSVVEEFPESINDYGHPVWKRLGTGYHWNEPLFGYYRTTDPWVLRKHAEMLADAGVDVIIFDATNGSFTWKNSYEVLFSVFERACDEGVRVPRVAFMLPFGPWPHSLKSITQLYDEVYKPGRYKDLWFMWKGKPLVMGYPDNVPEPIKSFFTFRPGQPVYKTGPQRPDHWGWLEIYPQHGFAKLPSGRFEQATVGVAQNATDTLWPAAMNDRDKSYGRGYTVEHGPNHSADAIARGLNFQEQWGRAFEIDPQLVFVTGWNEWIAGRYKVWQKTENAFPDQFNDEYSRDIEPTKGSFADNYYYQLIANVRRFKGVRPLPPASPPATISIDGKFDDWLEVGPEYRDHRGDTMHRNHPGYGKKTVYKNTSGRNDFISLKVARDEKNIYFLAETAKPITSDGEENWMTLLVDIDCDKSTGWEGYDVAINRLPPKQTGSHQTASFESHDNRDGKDKWKWLPIAPVSMKIAGNRLELSVPRQNFGGKDKPLDFEFKWIDNPIHPGDIMSFYQYGDAAPGGRFNYVYREKSSR